MTGLIRREPPRFPQQRAKFEEYYVDWRSSELDVDSLKRVLSGRWPPGFRFVYGIITNFWWTSLVIILPCLIAFWADRSGQHAWEGAGFFLLTAAIMLAALLSFTQILHVLASWWRPKEEYKPGYWFPCLLPRLARLTAVPMALIVEFDHSYAFPLTASSWALLLLMVMSFLTTRFFVTREIVDRNEKPGVVRITREEHRRVRQIVGLALAHSFGIAVLLSAIFAPSHESGHSPRDETATPGVPAATRMGVVPAKTEARKSSAAATRPATGHAATAAGSSLFDFPEIFLDDVDATSKDHPHRRFIGCLPREVIFDGDAIARKCGWHLPKRLAEIVGFRFYPTIILTWTALGLFFGVFLEGFMKGARLRGGTPREQDLD